MNLETKGAIDLKIENYYLVKLEGFNASGYCIAVASIDKLNMPIKLKNILREEQTLTDLSNFKITSVTKL